MIKLVVFDFDGVFTNGDILFDKNGSIKKKYNVKDGMGISLLKKSKIKIGILSGFKENGSQQKILEHLGIDYISIGFCKKIEKLNEWCVELNINLEKEVAYMGDDINDIECLNNVFLSGCPKDANDKCTKICKFISNKNGGEGCVREFCEYILDYIPNYNIIDQIRNESLYQLNNFNLNEINNLSKFIHTKNETNNIYFLAVGKSLNIAYHTCSVLNSINIKCFVLDTLNLLHGDIGCLNKDDLVICYSKSGNTNELIQVIPIIKNKGCYTIGIWCYKESKFKHICHQHIVLPFNNEIINGEIKYIPTNSYMSFLYFTNILTHFLIKESNVTVNEYKMNHPAGNIGYNLNQIKDVLITKFPKIIFNDKVHINDVLLEMTKYNIGCCFFTNMENELLGILTDGDIRRDIINNINNINKNIEWNKINTNYIYETDLNKFVKDCKKIGYIPILENNIILGIIKY